MTPGAHYFTANAGNESESVRADYAMGRHWLERGNLDRAERHFRNAQTLDPEFEGATEGLIYTLLERGDLAAARDASIEGVNRFPTNPHVQKALAVTHTQTLGFDEACRFHGLAHDAGAAPVSENAIVACTVIRDEMSRLPLYLTDLRQQGVDNIIAIDNGSTDGSVEYLRDQSDVMLWRTDRAFSAGNFGSAWFQILLSQYAEGHWVLLLDADEVFCYPGKEGRPLRSFCDDLDALGFGSATGLLIDMYGRQGLRDGLFDPADGSFAQCEYFDRHPPTSDGQPTGPFRNQIAYMGGMRGRVFGLHDLWLNKVPLLRYDSAITLTGGQHFTNVPEDITADLACAVLHYKFLSGFEDRARVEAARGEHSQGALEYQRYVDVLNKDAHPVPYDPAISVRFAGCEQLIDLGWIRPLPQSAS